MSGSLIGTDVRRVEDLDLVRGASTFVANLRFTGLLQLSFVRSSVAHGRLRAVDTGRARAARGVAAVYTAADLNIPAHHSFVPLHDAGKRPPLASDRVRFAGEAVAVVVADSRAAADDAAELVEVDIDPLPAVTDPERALEPGAPVQFDQLGSNVAGGQREPDGTDPLHDAEVVVRARMRNQRVAAVPLEGNAITVVPGDDTAGLASGEDGEPMTVYVATQMPHLLRDRAAELFGLPADRVRVVAPHVGGGFGAKAGIAPEHAVAIAASRRLGRPVCWVETRTENMTAMPHGRGQVQYAELGCRRDGTLTGLRIRVVADCGAYAGFGGALAMGPTRDMAQGVYRIPQLGYDAVAAMTNTTPVGAFRGAGRPEAAALLERIMDIAAARLGIDPAEIRRRNFIAPDRFPFTTRTGVTYDSGEYDRALTAALDRAGYAELRAEQARRRRTGARTQLGIGISTYVEITAGGGRGEFGSVRIHRDGTATITVGTSAHGQGHATSFAMLVADTLGIELADIRFVQSDTRAVPTGGGTGGSRSLQIGGSAVHGAAQAVLERGRALAARLLEAEPADIVTRDGQLGVAGVPDRAVSWAELAAAADEEGDPLAAAPGFEQSGPTFPFGAHVSVVEVDPETGLVTPRRHVAVDDCGRVLNPLLVAGQQHGGAAQGIAQALYEHVLFDSAGNPLSAGLADYTVPSAADVCPLEVANTETPTPHNPLGAKGIGESATVGATPAVQNAVIDAVAHLGVEHIDLPCTPQQVWRAIRDARDGSSERSEPWSSSERSEPWSSSERSEPWSSSERSEPWSQPPAAFDELPVRGQATEPTGAGADI